MNYIKKCFFSKKLIVFFGLIHLGLQAQQYNFKNYSVENGLPYIQIFTIFQDSKGYLWSGGYGGLSRFNGKTFYHYSPKNGLSNHYVNCITENQDGRIFIGTIDGLSVLNKNKITNYYEKNGLPSKNITSLCTDFASKTWIGTTKGLDLFENNKITTLKEFSDKTINSLYYSQATGLWIGTNTGLYTINNGVVVQYTLKDGLASDVINCITKKTNSQELYIGTKDGLSIFNTSTKKINNFHVINGLLDENIGALAYSTTDSLLWIGSKSGLISFNGKSFSYFTINSDNNSNHIRSLVIDYENNLWIGTHNGLYKFRDKSFTSYAKQEGLGGAFIFQVIEDKQKNIWLTTESNGVYKFENGFFKNYSKKDGLQSINVVSAYCDKENQLWFGTDVGISKYSNGKFENVTRGLSFNLEPPISMIFEDSKGNIWCGGLNGLCSMKKINGTYVATYYKLPTTVKDYGVWSIAEDNNGDIWAGTYLAGIFKLENNQFVNQNKSINGDFESAFEIEFDDTGNMFVATLNGVFIYNSNTKKSRSLTELDGLASELVYSIKLTNDKKTLWAGTNQGISKIDVQKLNQGIVSCISYKKADGFTGIECNTHGIYEDEHHDIWFGTVNGLIKYSASDFKHNDNLSKTNLNKIQIAYTDTLLQNGSELPYNLNNIAFYVDGISLTNPDKVLYSYYLEGFDKKWTPNTDINFIKYDNLPAGKYTFKAKSCNSEGIWSIEPVTFSFVVKAPFYTTWWFILSCLGLTIILILLAFRIRLQQEKKKQKLEFDNLVEVSKAELKALRAQMNPHFVFNSLNSIQHFILHNKTEEAARYLNKFAKLIRIILNNTEKPMVTVNEDVEAITLYLELEKMRFENKFNYSIIVNDTVDGDYDEIPPMLIQPYLENAILHGVNPKEETGHITVEISLINAFIKISIIDDGIGREKSKAIQSLQPAARHKSLGMKITKDRVRILNTMHQSNLNVNIIDLYNQNKEAIGTRVDLYIPYIK